MKKLFLKTMLLLCALVVGSSSLWADDYTLVTSLSVGDEVVLVNSGVSKELGGVTTSGTTYGTAQNVTNSTPVGAYILTVVAGKSENSIAFKTPANTYLSWSSGNSLTTATSVTNASSWTVSFKESGVATITNVGTSARKLQYNTGSPRFACYTSSQGDVKLYKRTTGGTSTCSKPTFNPAEGTYYAAQSVEISCTTQDATIYYTLDGNDPTTSSNVYSSAIAVDATTTIKAMAVKEGYENSEIETAVYTIKSPVTGYAIDFENDLEAYTDWTMTNIGRHTSGLTAAHSGSAWGSNVNEGDNGVGTASIQTKEKVANPGKFTCYISKESNNNTSSSWKIQVSSNGSSWTDIATLSSMTLNTWTKFEGDIAAKGYTDVYVRLYYDGATAKRAVDDIELTEDDGKQDCGLAFAASSYKVAPYTIFTQTVTNPNSLSVTYSSDDTDIAYVESTTGEVLTGDKYGTATITATFAGNDSFRPGTATYTITTYDPDANDGSEAKPYTVAEALTKIAALADNGTIPAVYVKGKVHEVTSYNDTYKSITYYIEDLDDNTKTLYVYGGKGLGNTDFTAETDLSVGDEVMLYGALQKYVKNSTTTPEFTSNNYIAQYKHGSEPEVKSLQVKAAEYRTYVASANLVVPTGVKAYIATGESETTLTLKSVAKIKKDSPVILNASEGYYSFEITDEAVDYGTDTNLLQISDGTVTNGVFVLAKINDQVGFYKWAGGALSPGKVYVEAPSSTAREFLGFEVENDVTGINEVKGEKKVVDGIFDLQGRKVVTPSKGLYIMNGKKVVIK